MLSRVSRRVTALGGVPGGAAAAADVGAVPPGAGAVLAGAPAVGEALAGGGVGSLVAVDPGHPGDHRCRAEEHHDHAGHQHRHQPVALLRRRAVHGHRQQPRRRVRLDLRVRVGSRE